MKKKSTANNSLVRIPGRKESGFTSLSTARDEIETQNRVGIPYSSRIVPRGLSVAEGPETVPHNAAHLYSHQANLLEDPAETRTCKLTLESQAS